MVKIWAVEFECGFTSSLDEVHEIVMDDCQLTVIQIVEAAIISPERVYVILLEHLGMRKLIEGLLASVQQWIKTAFGLKRFKLNANEFCHW